MDAITYTKIIYLKDCKSVPRETEAKNKKVVLAEDRGRTVGKYANADSVKNHSR